ncbi:unnamed protein product, partial [Thlaspi arvense]
RGAAKAKRRHCAVCTTRNIRCSRICEFADYFPYELLREYESANDLFGTPNILKMMRLAPTEQKSVLASSILIEGIAWTCDPVRGGFGMLQRLVWEVQVHEAYLNELKEKIKDKKRKR